MTAARRPRSAALLVGSTSATSANVHSAGQSLSRFFASARTCGCRLPAEPHSSSGHSCFLISPTRCLRAARSPSCWNCFQAWKTFQVTSSPSRPNASCGPEPRSAWKVKSRRTRLLEQLLVDRLERLAGAGQDRVDRADRDRAAKQLLHQLDQLPTRKD